VSGNAPLAAKNPYIGKGETGPCQFRCVNTLFPHLRQVHKKNAPASGSLSDRARRQPRSAEGRARARCAEPWPARPAGQPPGRELRPKGDAKRSALQRAPGWRWNKSSSLCDVWRGPATRGGCRTCEESSTNERIMCLLFRRGGVAGGVTGGDGFRGRLARLLRAGAFVRGNEMTESSGGGAHGRDVVSESRLCAKGVALRHLSFKRCPFRSLLIG
jgi:hypothetical protein